MTNLNTGTLPIASLDHVTTGIMLSKNGGTLAVRSATVTTTVGDVHGCYKVTLSATDTNTLGRLRVIYTDASVTLPVWQDFDVISTSAYDAIVSGSPLLPVDVTKWLTGIIPTPITAGTPQVDLYRITNSLVSTTTAQLGVNVVQAATRAWDSGAIVAGTIGADAITAAKIQDGAIDAASLASDVPTKIRSVFNGTADSGTLGTLVDADLNQADTAYWKGCWVLFTSGSIAGQVRQIQLFDPVTDTISFVPDTSQAVSTNNYEILPAGAVDVRLWQGNFVSAPVLNRIDVSVGAMATNVLINDVIHANAVTKIQNGLATSTAQTTAQSDLTNIKNVQLPAALDINGFIKADVEALIANTESAIDLQTSAKTIVRGIVQADVGNSTTQIKTDLPSGTNSHYNGRIIIFTSGVLADQATSISTYVGATRTIGMVLITSVPADGVAFVVV